MKKYYFVYLLLAGFLFFISCKDNLSEKGEKDWLIDGENYVSKVLYSEDTSLLILSNGLIERHFRLIPNFATVGIKNIVTLQNYLRASRPEAQITVDGQNFNIGGLIGQPVQSYLPSECLDTLQSEPNSFSCTGHSVRDIQPRFLWKKHFEWLPEDPNWPPKGKELTVNFEVPVLNVSKNELDAGFSTRLGNDWRIKSSLDKSISFNDKGIAGNIKALANSYCFAERELPPDVRVVQCLVDPGTDKGKIHGPGIALVFPSFTIKFNINSVEKKFGIYNGMLRQAFKYGQVEEGKPYYLRMKLAENLVICEASIDFEKWEEINRITVNDKPSAVRIGKIGESRNGTKDLETKGTWGWSTISEFRIYGDSGVTETIHSVFKGIKVQVHYEIYDGIPLICKWISIDNQTGRDIKLNKFTSEIIAAVEGSTQKDEISRWELPNFHVETDYGSGIRGMSNYENIVNWVTDPSYTSQIDYELTTPCLLEVRPPIGPEQIINVGNRFESYRTWELFYDSYEKERKSLSLRRMYRTIAPWVLENPLLMHVRQADSASVKLAIDQCAEVGFEMVIMTFGSGFNMESGDTAYYKKMKEYADYAHSKGVALGGYSLLASRSISEKDDVINPKTGKPGGFAVFGESPCLASEWATDYFRKIQELYEASGLDVIEHDGSYPGDVCASNMHPGHKGLADSQWAQRKVITNFYNWCRSKGIYLNVPDHYCLSGSNKSAMGYREVNWALPRAQQEIIERQNIYDGTWTKTPSMGWMFVPLVQYKGNGVAAAIEPLKDHLPHYEQRLINLLGAGVQACFRGPRLFDTDSTKVMVKKWVDFYKTHRQILDSDIIHLRRPDGSDWDGFLHVDPSGEEKGLLMLNNPLNEEITRIIKVPVYYSGLSERVWVINQGGDSKAYSVSRDYNISVKVTIPAKGYNYFILK